MAAITKALKKNKHLTAARNKSKNFPNPSFVKRQFNKLVWPTTEYITNTSAIVIVITLLAMGLLHLVFDPMAIKLVLSVKQ